MVTTTMCKTWISLLHLKALFPGLLRWTGRGPLECRGGPGRGVFSVGVHFPGWWKLEHKKADTSTSQQGYSVDAVGRGLPATALREGTSYSGMESD